ncbi:BTAD domain-containing putative transcriptional regulator [Saccharothrix saharensis]|uniref:AfsR/SARP family transcriptional regulator n=1 Tax=Saccharothrix saharensis TaxID=571190 RepID=UPI003681BB92
MAYQGGAAAMWEFGVLGPMIARRDGTAVTLSAAKHRVVLAALLVRPGTVVPVDALVTALWGDEPPDRARSTCQAYVMRLRQALGDGAVVRTCPGGYLLDVTPEQVDVGRFTALTKEAGVATRPEDRAELLHRALALWRGQALVDVPSESLHRDVAPALTEQRLRALAHRVDADLALGRHEELVGELTALTAEHPFQERFWAQLMLALHRCNRQADALHVYQELDRTLVEELGLRPGEEVRALQEAILKEDPALAAPVGRVVRVRPAVPPDIGDFVGRDELIREAEDRLRATGGSAAPIVVLSGPPGVGKSALAVHLAHRLNAEFPDGVLHVNLHGYSNARPTSVTQALGYFVRVLGMPAEQVPLAQDELESHYRAMLSGRRMLVVLDNAADADQVRPLLPADAACAALVTSRSELRGLTALQGARRLSLDVLTEDEARDLLVAILGADAVAAQPAASGALAGLCARLPLALRIAAANLSARPRPDIADYVAELRQDDRLAALAVEGDDSAAVRSAFSASYAALTAQARVLFRRLGLLPGTDFTAPAAAALLGVPFGTATRLLEALAAASLVQQHAPRRYQFHDLLRLYARTRAAEEEPEPERTAALRRWLEHCLHTADAAAELLNPTLSRLTRPAPTSEPVVPYLGNGAEAAAWFAAEHGNLVAAIEHAATAEPELCWHLADAVRGYLYSRRLDADLLAVTDTALAAAHGQGQRDVVPFLRNSRGMLHWSRGDYDSAVRDLDAALEGHRAVGSRTGEAVVLSNLGIVRLELGEVDTAVEHTSRALELCRELGQRRTEAATLVNLGFMHLERGELDRAEEHLHLALTLCERLDLAHTGATARNNLGGVRLRQGRLNEALAHHTAALETYRRLHARHDEAEVLQNLAATHREAGRYDEAVECGTQALELARRTGNMRYEADALNTLGSTALRSGDRATARRRHHEALVLCAHAGYAQGQITARIGLGRELRAAGQADLGQLELQAALALARESGFRLREAQALVEASLLELDLRHHDAARDLAEEALRLHREIGDPFGQAQALRLLGSLARKPEEAAGLWRAALGLLRRIGVEEVTELALLLHRVESSRRQPDVNNLPEGVQRTAP